MILHLFQKLPYVADEGHPTDLSEAYDSLLSRIDRAEIGSEACMQLSSVLTVLQTGFQAPPTEAMKHAVEQGAPIPTREGDLVIEPGDYRFAQLATTPSGQEIERTLASYAAEQACDGSSPIYLRLVKENILEVIVQVLWRA